VRADEESLRDVPAANARFREEVRRWDLRFRCEDCAHVEPSTFACSLGFPNRWLRGEVVAVEPGGGVAFCKTFELGESRAIDPDAVSRAGARDG
jgi:hypothetical protein